MHYVHYKNLINTILLDKKAGCRYHGYVSCITYITKTLQIYIQYYLTGKLGVDLYHGYVSCITYITKTLQIYIQYYLTEKLGVDTMVTYHALRTLQKLNKYNIT